MRKTRPKYLSQRLYLYAGLGSLIIATRHSPGWDYTVPGVGFWILSGSKCPCQMDFYALLQGEIEINTGQQHWLAITYCNTYSKKRFSDRYWDSRQCCVLISNFTFPRNCPRAKSFIHCGSYWKKKKALWFPSHKSCYPTTSSLGAQKFKHRDQSDTILAVLGTCFSDRQGGVGWIPIISISERQCLSLSQPKCRSTQEPNIKTSNFKAFGLTLWFLLEQTLGSTRHTYSQSLLHFLLQTIFCSIYCN